MSKRVALITLAAASALIAASCGGVGSNSTNDGGDKNSKTIRVAGFGADDEIAQIRLEKAKKDLGLSLRLNKGSFDEQQFLTSVSSGNPPDVVNMGRGEVATYAARGPLTPLNDCIDQNNIDTSQYRQQAIDEVTYKGKIYGIPEFYNYSLLLVNNRVARQSGIDPKDIDTGSWASLTRAAKAMTKIEDGKITRLGFDPQLPDTSALWPRIHGIQPLEEDGKTAAVDTGKLMQTYTGLKKLTEAQGGWTNIKSFKDSWDFFGEKNPFVTDQVGAIVAEQWYLTVLAETAPDDVDFTALPLRDDNGKPMTMANGGSWVVPQGSSNPDGACKLAKAMTAADSWVAAGSGKVKAFKKQGKYYAGTYTGNKRADQKLFGEVWKPTGGKYSQFDDAVETALSVQNRATSQPASAIGIAYNDALQGALNRILQGEQAPAPALKRAQSEVDKASKQVG